MKITSGISVTRRIFATVSTVALLSVSALSLLLTPVTTSAFSASIQDGANAAKGRDQLTDLFGTAGIFTTVTNVLLFVVGAVSVIMIIIGGLRYVTSGGNSSNVSAAKNTILYAVVGIVIALLAYAVVNFVIGSFSGGAGGFGGSGGTDV